MVLYTLLFTATLLYLLYLYFTRTFNYWKDRNVAGPKPLPFFGNLLQSTLRRRRVAHILEDIYNEYPNEKVVGVYRMTTPCLLIKDLELIKHVMIKDFDCFTDRGVEFAKEGLGSNLFHADGDSWKMLRGKFTPMFTSGKLKNMLYLMLERGDAFMNYLDKISNESREQDMHKVVQKFTMATISACAFGIDINILDHDFDTLDSIDKKIFTINYLTELDMMYPGILKKINTSLIPVELASFFGNLASNVLKSRNGKPSNRKDFMDLMLELREEGELHGSNKLSNDPTSLKITEAVMAAQTFVFYAAGYETSATTMTFMLYHLALNTKIQDKLVAQIDEVLQKYNNEISYDALSEMKYLEMVFNETLRMYPIVDVLQRNAKVDLKLPGTDVVVKKDQTLLVAPLGLHYDERYFKNPKQFDPERFAPENVNNIKVGSYVPFGIGPRNCIGMRFARIQTWVCMVKFFTRFRVETSANTKLDIDYDPYRFVLSPANGLPLNLVPRVK